MSNNSVTVKHLIAALKMVGKIGDKIMKAKAILAALTGNATFPVATWPANVTSLAQLGTDVTALINAEAAVVNKTGTAALRNEALAVVLADLRSIKTMVQLKADANPTTAQSIIEGAGYVVSMHGGRAKRQNDALNTELLGTALLTSDTAGHHEWEMSKDMITIINLPATTTCTTTVKNLTQGDVWYFRNRKVNTKKRTYNWCAWIKLTIGPGGKVVVGGNTPGHAGSLPTT